MNVLKVWWSSAAAAWFRRGSRIRKVLMVRGGGGGVSTALGHRKRTRKLFGKIVVPGRPVDVGRKGRRHTASVASRKGDFSEQTPKTTGGFLQKFLLLLPPQSVFRLGYLKTEAL